MRYHADGDQDHQLQQLFNKGLTFGDNMDASMVEITLSEGENTVQHGLGRKPIGYIVIAKSSPGEIHGDTSSWNSQTLLLQSSVKNQKVRLIVL